MSKEHHHVPDAGKKESAVEWFSRQLIHAIDAKEAMGQHLDVEDISYYLKLANDMFVKQMMNAQMDMFLHMDKTPYGIKYLQKRDDAHTYSEKYIKDRYGKHNGS